MTRERRKASWRDPLLGALLVWAGVASVPSSLHLYGGHRGTVSGWLVLLSESGLLAGSAIMLALAAASALVARNCGADEAVWVHVCRRGFRRLTLVSLVVLAWCLGSLR